MESVISDVVDKLFFFFILGAFLGLAVLALKLLFYRSVVGKLLGGKKGKGGKGRRVEPEGVLKAAEFTWNKYKESSERKSRSQEKERFDLYEVFKESDKSSEDRNFSEVLMDRGGAYTARPFLMTPVERNVYKVLEKAYGDRYRIFCQVRVVDIIQPNEIKYHPKSREYLSLFRQLSQWHFDYVLCHRDDFRVFCALELDDASHKRLDRVKRDRIINQACKVSGVTLKRLKVNHGEKKIEVV